MRSRFSAFARGEAEYLWRTLHSDHTDRAALKEPTVAALKRVSASYKYMRLRILDARGAEVLFRASVFEKGNDLSFMELSTFAREGGAWRYLSGIMKPADERAWTVESFAAEMAADPGG
jgi:SEC-C motif-containing protein